MTENNVRTYRCKICNRLLFTTEKWGGDVYLYRKLPKQPVVKILVKNSYYVKCACGSHYRFNAARGRLSHFSPEADVEPDTKLAYPVFKEIRR